MKKLLLVDYSNLLYRATFANFELTHKTNFTGGIYGFINMLSSSVNRYNLDRVVVCMDRKPYHRAKFYPAYKANRRSDMEENTVKKLAQTKKYIGKLLELMSIPICAEDGHEADDFIGKYCKRMRQSYEIFIMSNDSDFYQLLSPNVFLVKTAGLYGNNTFTIEHNVDYRDWPLVIAMAGSHNGVPGIFRVGEKTAIKYLDLLGADEIPRFIHKKYGDDHKPATLRLRQKLATFPFPLAQQPPLTPIRPLDYDANKFEELCDKHGIRFKTEFHNAFVRLSN